MFVKDEDLLIDANDYIENAVFSALSYLVHEHDQLEWDMSIIGPVTDYMQDMLHDRGIATCRPWQDENECICYATADRCPYCTKGK